MVWLQHNFLDDGWNLQLYYWKLGQLKNNRPGNFSKIFGRKRPQNFVKSRKMRSKTIKIHQTYYKSLFKFNNLFIFSINVSLDIKKQNFEEDFCSLVGKSW